MTTRIPIDREYRARFINTFAPKEEEQSRTSHKEKGGRSYGGPPKQRVSSGHSKSKGGRSSRPLPPPKREDPPLPPLPPKQNGGTMNRAGTSPRDV